MFEDFVAKVDGIDTTYSSKLLENPEEWSSSPSIPEEWYFAIPWFLDSSRSKKIWEIAIPSLDDQLISRKHNFLLPVRSLNHVDDKWKKIIQFGKKSWTNKPFHYMVPIPSTALP